MRSIILPAALLTAAAAFGANTNEFRPVIPTHRPRLIEASKAASITNGITLGQVVKHLGPGWMPDGKFPDGSPGAPVESVGIIRWSFTDGRQLNLVPKTRTANDILSSVAGAGSRYWFSTNTPYAPKRQTAQPVAPHEPPPRASVSDAPDDRTLDSLPAPGSSGGR
jgi:hypothetical protein